MKTNLTTAARNRLNGLSAQAREATLDLLAIAQGEQATREYGAQLIRRHQLAVQDPTTGRHYLTQAGLDYLTRVFTPSAAEIAAERDASEFATYTVSL